MAAEMVEKPLTEAQRIIRKLESEFKMTRGAIAREIGVSAPTIQNIAKLHTTGDAHLHRLNLLANQLLSGSDSTQKPSNRDSGNATPNEPLVRADELLAVVRSEPEPAGVILSGEDPTPAPERPLRERAGDWLRAAMFGSDSESSASAAPATAKRAKKGAESGEAQGLVEQLAPLAALVVVLSGSTLIPDPYKPCGPNHPEAMAIVYPIVKRAVRELDARKKIGEGTMDAIAILLAVSAYGVRAHGTYQQIHAEEVARARSDNTSQPGYPAGTFGNAGAGAGGLRNQEPRAFRRDAGNAHQADRGAGREAHHEAVGGDERRSDPLIDALLREDAAGRKRLGIG